MKTIQIDNALPPSTAWHKRNGTEPKNTQGVYSADIEPGKSIRIFGVMTNHAGGPQWFDKTFRIGDEAEYGSYNLIYTGKIVRIGAKTVQIAHGTDYQPQVTQLSVYEFIDRNWNFDAAKIAAYNAEEMQCI